MGWFGGGSDGSSHDSSSATVVQLEQQIEMMDMVFMKYPLGYGASVFHNHINLHRAVKQCGGKCIPGKYVDGELNKGESVCVQRCLNKFMDVLEVVSSQLAEVGMQAQGAPPI